MPDQLYLSCWLRGFSANNMLRHFERLLRLFPHSRLAPGATLRLRAVDLAEPELLERRFPDAARVEEILAAAQEFRHPDIAAEVETAWDLWQLRDEWRLTPAPARLSCFGPRFESEAGEHLRVDFGLDSHFLPQPEYPEGLKMVRSNITSLLRLVRSLDEGLAIERRQLWSESGENFAERLQSALR